MSLPLFTKGHKTTTWNSHVLHICEKVNCTRTIFKIPFAKFDAVLPICLGYFWQYRQTEWPFSHEILRLNIKLFLMDVVAVAVWTAFWNLGSERLPALSSSCLLGCLACVGAFVCRLSKHFSAVHSLLEDLYEGFTLLTFLISWLLTIQQSY